MPKKQPKYITVKIGGIITQIARPTEIPGYTEGVIEAFLPDEDKLSDKECDVWIKQNNHRMTEICKFMNNNNL